MIKSIISRSSVRIRPPQPITMEAPRKFITTFAQRWHPRRNGEITREAQPVIQPNDPRKPNYSKQVIQQADLLKAGIIPRVFRQTY